jgi:hypothetical protein
MQVEVSMKSGFSDRCPRCKSNGPFHTPTPEEIAAASTPKEVTVSVPESETRWLSAVLTGATALLLLALWWWLK